MSENTVIVQSLGADGTSENTVIVQFIVHDPQPVSQGDVDDIWGTLETAGNSVGLEMISVIWNTPNAADK